MIPTFWSVLYDGSVSWDSFVHLTIVLFAYAS